MKSSLSHLADPVLLRELRSLVARDRTTTAELLAHLAEADERRLHLPAAYPSMYLYCIHELHMSEDTALKRIQVARVARRIPAVLSAIADGRLHLSAVVLLAPRLTAENADELLAAAAYKTKFEIELLLAERFPRPDVPTSVRAVAAEELVPGSVDGVAAQHAPAHVQEPSDGESTAGLALQHAPGHVGRPTIAPLSPGRFEVRFTLGQVGHDKLAYAQSLLGHAVPSGDISHVIERGLDRLIEHLEKRVFAASARSRPPRGAAKNCRVRHIPAEVRREVWRRDGGRCTFVGRAGQRCPACTRLEFDHVEPVARGGESTVPNLRLSCRAHNQYAADRAFGAGFMDRKRRESRRRATRAGIGATATIEHAPGHVESRSAAMPEHAPGHVDSWTAPKLEHAPGHVGHHHDEVIPWLRALGFRADEARQGAAMCEGMPDAPLEERMRLALAGLGRARFQRATRVASPAG